MQVRRKCTDSGPLRWLRRQQVLWNIRNHLDADVSKFLDLRNEAPGMHGVTVLNLYGKCKKAPSLLRRILVCSPSL